MATTPEGNVLSAPYDTPRVITAATTNVRLSDKRAIGGVYNASKAIEWQEHAWQCYRSIGEIWIAANLIAATTSRIRLYPAYVEDETVDPKPIGEAATVPAELRDAARDALTRLSNHSVGGISGLLQKIALNLFVAGDGYLVQERDGFDETWSFQSVSSIDIVKSTGEVSIVGYPGQPKRDRRVLSSTDYFSRIYRQHPEFPDLADSSMQPQIQSCQELMSLSQAASSTVLSRLNSGILAIPDSFEASNREISDALEQNEFYDFYERLVMSLSKPLEDPGDPSSVLPTIVKGPAEDIAKIRYISISRAFDEKHQEQMQDVRGRILSGLDLPKDIVSGIGDLKYANAHSVENSLLQNHVQPLALAICDALTRAYLRPILAAQGFGDAPQMDKIVFWYDPTAITAKTDREVSSRTGLENDALSAAAWRRANGYSDNDAPSQTEIAQKMAIKRGVLSAPVSEAILRTLIPEILDRVNQQGLADAGDTAEVVQELG